MKIIGCDFHASYQQIVMWDKGTGEAIEKALPHDRKEEVRAFYAGLEGPVGVGIEASGQSKWFERMLSELGHEVWIGDAAKRRRGREFDAHAFRRRAIFGQGRSSPGTGGFFFPARRKILMAAGMAVAPSKSPTSMCGAVGAHCWPVVGSTGHG